IISHPQFLAFLGLSSAAFLSTFVPAICSQVRHNPKHKSSPCFPRLSGSLSAVVLFSSLYIIYIIIFFLRIAHFCIMKSIADIRKDYIQKMLSETDVLANPIEQFKVWFEEALL